MKIIVFTGPSLSVEAGREVLDAVWRPPVQQGDVCRAVHQDPDAIGIIDGLYERVPAVWHKEILWALSKGIAVFGAASMGALRASELAAFGMRGVGAIFEAFHSGALEDDDEVAITHGDASVGFKPTSEAMVNIRHTIAAACGAGILSEATAQACVGLAKARFYPERNYPNLLSDADDAGLPEAEMAAFRAWLPTGQVDQKRADALTMLTAMKAWGDGQPTREAASFTFEPTEMWEMLRQRAGRFAARAALAAEAATSERILDEIRLRPGVWGRALVGARSRALALEVSAHRGLRVGPEEMETTSAAFRARHGLEDPQRARRWLELMGMSEDAYFDFIEEEARVDAVEAQMAQIARSQIEPYLKGTGDYLPASRRAAHKGRALATHGAASPTLAMFGLSEDALWRWYFGERCGQPVPEDLSTFAEAAGFEDVADLRRAVLREFAFSRFVEGR